MFSYLHLDKHDLTKIWKSVDDSKALEKRTEQRSPVDTPSILERSSSAPQVQPTMRMRSSRSPSSQSVRIIRGDSSTTFGSNSLDIDTIYGRQAPQLLGHHMCPSVLVMPEDLNSIAEAEFAEKQEAPFSLLTKVSLVLSSCNSSVSSRPPRMYFCGVYMCCNDVYIFIFCLSKIRV